MAATAGNSPAPACGTQYLGHGGEPGPGPGPPLRPGRGVLFLGRLCISSGLAAVENGLRVGARLLVWRDAVVAPYGAGPGRCRRRYQRFKWDVIIAPIEADRWALDATGILSWLESAAAGTNTVVRLAVEER